VVGRPAAFSRHGSIQHIPKKQRLHVATGHRVAGADSDGNTNKKVWGVWRGWEGTGMSRFANVECRGLRTVGAMMIIISYLTPKEVTGKLRHMLCNMNKTVKNNNERDERDARS
jgi:hypothetical protein